MSSKKMITVTPELFNVSGKTRKKREKKDIAFNPIIAPNSLKNKLLKRIKEHKMNETGQKPKEEKKETNFSDEFYSAVSYLSDLKNKQKQQKALYNKTIRNHTNTVPTYSNVNLEDTFNTVKPSVNDEISMQMHYKTEDNVPYGCLKGGKKKTYRQWQEELKIQETPGLQDILVARPPTPPKKAGFFEEKQEQNINKIFSNANINTNISANENTTISKEERLENIRNKLKQLEDNETFKRQQELEEIETQLGFKDNGPIIPDIDDYGDTGLTLTEIFDKHSKKSMPNKNYIKRTVKRKFTLGKSDKLRKVAILIKDKQTRKNVLNTQKDLKKASITDVKRYLRQHGMIKTSTTCPPDILRKMYESALMAGEITNVNKDTLLHNFLNHSEQ